MSLLDLNVQRGHMSPKRSSLFMTSLLQASTLQRKFFITQKGSMGTGQPKTLPGDKFLSCSGERYYSCYANKLIQRTSLVAFIIILLFQKVLRTRFSGCCSGVAMSMVLCRERLLMTGRWAIEGIGGVELCDKDAFLAKHMFLLALLNFTKHP